MVTQFQSILDEALNNAVTNAFTTTLQTEAKEVAPYATQPGHMIMSSIGFTGDISGNFTFILPVEGAAFLVSKMLFTEVEPTSPDVCDGIGELMNLIAGGVKMNVGDQCNFEISVPNTLRAMEISLSPPHADECQICKYYQTDKYCYAVTLMAKGK